MRTRFKVSHDLTIEKEYGKREAKIRFKTEIKDGEYKAIEISIDEYDIINLAGKIREYVNKTEEEKKVIADNQRATRKKNTEVCPHCQTSCLFKKIKNKHFDNCKYRIIE